MSAFNPNEAAPQSNDTAVVSLRRIALFLFRMAGGETALTPTVSTKTASGTVAAGAKYIEFIFSPDFAGTIGGVAFSGANDLAYGLPLLQGGTYAALPYTITAGSARLTVLT